MSTRGFSLTPLLSGIACLAAVSGGVVYGQHHPVNARHDKTTHGEWVSIPTARGRTVKAYVAYPERKDRAPALIVIHEIFGMNAWVSSVADKYAAKGYVAIAPDLLSSQYGSTDSVGQRATQLISSLPDSIMIPDLDAVYKYVNGLVATQPDNTGLIGFCWGGGAVWKYAAANAKVKAAVPCYGPVSDTSMLRTVTAPVFAVYAEQDNRVTGMMPGIKAAMDNHHHAFSYDIYKGVGHGFLRDGAPGTDSPEANRARADIDAFFSKTLDHK